MADVLFYQNYTPVADVCTMAFCIINWLLLRSTYTIKQKNLTMFWCANFFMTLAAFSNIAFHELVKILSEKYVVWTYISRDAAYISMMLVYAIFSSYVENLVDLEQKKRKYFNVLLWGGFGVFALWEVMTPFTRLGFWIDSELRIHQNYYLDVFRFSYIYNTVLITVLMISNRRKFITKVYHCICRVMLVSLTVMVLQSLLLSTSYCCISFTFPIIAAMFLFHYNGYDVDTGTLDAKAFDAYIRDMGDRPFSMVCLHLQNIRSDNIKKMSEDFFHFNEKFFRSYCTFRLRDDKMVVVYEDAKNKSVRGGTEAILEEFRALYDRYQMDYRIVFLHSQQALVQGMEYLALDEFIEERMPVNTAYHCEKEDVDGFLKAAYILEELRDIHRKQDLEDARVKVYCQPVLDTITDTFSSAEALMRLELPECGMVFPDQFIPLAEKHGYIHTLSKIILNKTCRQILALEEQGYQLDRVSVNFSIIELKDRDFCDDVTKIISDSGLPFEKIAIELTESRNEKDFENVKNIMTNLQGLGVKFYLDDFGTGYSNFERIIGLPIDIIKFDRSLTILAGKNEESRLLVGSFSDIFKKSNYQILFEGIEDERDENQCKKMNAQYLQGYKYSRPIPMEELSRFLKKTG